MKIQEIKNDLMNNISEKLSTKVEKSINDICEDQYIGRLEINNNTVESIDRWIIKKHRIDKKEKLYKLNKENGEKLLVIVLESPHKDEFSKDIIGPALGSTGRMLDEQLELKINNYLQTNSLQDGTYKIILMNGIQYQTSLGINTEYFRDRIWIKMWIENNYREEFINRLKTYEPDVIINLCTKGSHTNDPLFSSDSAVELKTIRINYLKNIVNEINQDEKGNLTFENKNLFDTKYSKNKGNDKKEYSLQGFVETAIDEYSLNKEIVLIKGVHPSSRYFIKGEFSSVI